VENDFMTQPGIDTSRSVSHPEVDETRMIEEAQKDPAAFGQLYQIYVQPVFKYLYSRIGRAAEAEDATAQTFLAALEGLRRYRNEGHFAAWLFGIARRKAIDHFRSEKRIVQLEHAEQIPTDGDLLGQAIHSEQNQALLKLLRSLPEDERELIRLRYVAELNFADIGQLLRRSEEATKKSLYRLLALLECQLEAYHE
jgi:RNA polymerase sigma-70 factor (ECF subfamily)